MALIRVSAADPVKTPAPATETERTPAPNAVTNGAAFYAPKIDVFIEDALGREWQLVVIAGLRQMNVNVEIAAQVLGEPDRPGDRRAVGGVRRDVLRPDAVPFVFGFDEPGPEGQRLVARQAETVHRCFPGGRQLMTGNPSRSNSFLWDGRHGDDLDLHQSGAAGQDGRRGMGNRRPAGPRRAEAVPRRYRPAHG